MSGDRLLAHLHALAERLQDRFGALVTAVWGGGSLALEDVRPDSDLDVAVVVDRPLEHGERRSFAETLLASARAVPARGLEGVVYARQDLTQPERGRYQVNVDGGPAMRSHVGEPDDDPSFWFVVDLAILRAAGRPVVGPPPEDLIAEVPEEAIRAALRRSLAWHRRHGDRPAHEILNACRAWHHVETGGWASKTVAARWAAERLDGAARGAVEAAAAARADPALAPPGEEGARLVSGIVRSRLDPRVRHLAAFAERPGGGNPAGVVLTDRPLPDEDMQRIATDVGYSETAFLVPSRADGRRLTVRYFSPAAEVPFCGHATIAAGVALGAEVGPGTFVLETAGGDVHVEVEVGDDDGPVATLTSVAPTVEQPTRDLLDRALETLRIDRGALDDRFEPAVGDAGARHLLLVLADRGTLGALDYDFAGLRAVMEDAGLTTVALLWQQDAQTWHARNPFPVGGVVEDPATGAAAAAFGAYLRDREHLDPPASFQVLQGHDMGRPSVLTVEVPVGREGIRVSGTAQEMPTPGYASSPELA